MGREESAKLYNMHVAALAAGNANAEGGWAAAHGEAANGVFAQEYQWATGAIVVRVLVRSGG